MTGKFLINEFQKSHRGNMKLKFYTLCLILIVFTTNNIAQEKLAQTGMQFLSVISDGRAAALGGSVNSRELQSSALFFNPATMGFDTSFVNASFSRNEWIADITNNNFSLSVNPADGDFGIFGASLQLIDYGKIEGTIVSSNEQGYIDMGDLYLKQ